MRSFYALRKHQRAFSRAFKSRAYQSAFEYGSRTVKRILIANAERRPGRPFAREELLRFDFYNYGAAAMNHRCSRRLHSALHR